MTREEYILSVPWRHGCCCGAVVCDSPGEQTCREHEATVFYGGVVIGESMPKKVRDHVIALHNASLAADAGVNEACKRMDAQDKEVARLRIKAARLEAYHETLATICRAMKGPCICGCHLSEGMNRTAKEEADGHPYTTLRRAESRDSGAQP